MSKNPLNATDWSHGFTPSHNRHGIEDPKHCVACGQTPTAAAHRRWTTAWNRLNAGESVEQIVRTTR
jgi:hypothetical protein